MRTKQILAVLVSVAMLGLSAAPALADATPKTAIATYVAQYDNAIGGHWNCKGTRINLKVKEDVFTCTISDISTLLPGTHTQAEFGWNSDYDGIPATSFTLTVVSTSSSSSSAAAAKAATTGPGFVQGTALY